ncbi:hypothetical protein KR038_008575 [Drosophila bunnanda]|nr:hypothetical protein KR038_008575 [Drosophila bunnanda]
MTIPNAIRALLVILSFQLLGTGTAQLLDDRCQRSYRSRVIGGKRSERAPWMAYLVRNGYFACGGSLIANRFVLTAAHCTQVNDNLYVRLGELDSATRRDGPTEDFRVIQIFRHENYVTHMSHDIAVLKLDRSVVYRGKKNPIKSNIFLIKSIFLCFAANIRPICIILDTKLRSKVNAIQDFTLTGWGQSAHYYQMPTRLQRLNVRRINEYWCNNQAERFCCQNPAQFVCFGDSGSPLGAMVLYRKRIIFAQFGIASSVTGNCDGYSIFTDVFHYTPWIVATIRRHWH